MKTTVNKQTMGSDQVKQKRRAEMPQNPRLLKGYSCYYHNISSFPTGMEKRKCTVLNYTPNHKLYTLCDDAEPSKIYSSIPYFYVSGCVTPYTWDRYFKIGTIVSYNNTSSEILEIRHELDGRVSFDLKELETGYLKYSIPPGQIFLDIPYYRDW